MTEHNLPEPDDAPWLNLSQEEINQLRYNKQELTEYGREKIRALMLKSQMTETDISKVLIEGDTATIMGVKYKRVEEPKPKTLYEALDEVYYGTTYANKEDICGVVERWLPNEMEHDEDLNGYRTGWNDCINTLNKQLR